MNPNQTPMMMKAIETRFLGPTNYRPSRVVAVEPDGKRIVQPWNHQWSATENHANAARALADKLGWNAPLIGGSLQNSYVWVFTR
jgi:hypothetical protein